MGRSACEHLTAVALVADGAVDDWLGARSFADSLKQLGRVKWNFAKIVEVHKVVAVGLRGQHPKVGDFFFRRSDGDNN